MIIDDVLERAAAGERLSAPEALALADSEDPRPLMRVAATLRDEGHGGLVSYSRKVFIPLTQLCRDVCHYCTFAHPPRPGEPAYLSSDQVLAIARAGARAGCHEAAVPFTSGILIGIGETRRERIESLLALRDLHDRYGHLQEIIIQNFRAKPGTRMAQAPEPDLEDHLWTIAVARLIFGS